MAVWKAAFKTDT